MTEAIADIVAELDRVDRERAVLMDRLRALTSAPAPTGSPHRGGIRTDLIGVKAAERMFDVSRSLLYKRATKLLDKKKPCTFAFRTDNGDIEYSISGLQEEFQRRPPRRRRGR